MIVITGASDGLGLELAKLYKLAGVRVINISRLEGEMSDEVRWLDTSVTDALFDMPRPISQERLLVTEVGIDIYSLKIDTPKLVEPL